MSNRLHKGLGKSFGKMFGNDKVRTEFLGGNDSDNKDSEVSIDLSKNASNNTETNYSPNPDKQSNPDNLANPDKQATQDKSETQDKQATQDKSEKTAPDKPTPETKPETQADGASQTLDAEKTPSPNSNVDAEKTPSPNSNAEAQLTVRISLIQPNINQPRKNFNEAELDELAESIKKYGVVEPIIIRKNGPLYEIIAGERRWRAAKLAGLEKVPVVIKEYDDRTAKEVSLIENIQRANLNPIEEALAYQSLIEEYGLTQEEVARRVSKNRSTITNALRILNLNTEIQEMLKDGKLSQGHARALLAIEDESLREKIAKRVIDENLSVREIEKLVRLEGLSQYRDKKRAENNTPAMQQLKIFIHDLERQLKHKYNTKVDIVPKNEDAGKIELEYYSKSDLDRLFVLLNGINVGNVEKTNDVKNEDEKKE